MGKFKPQVSYKTDDSVREYRNGQRKSEEITTVFDTYAKLKSRMKAILNASQFGHAFVVRSRRGEWGEWFEHWYIGDNGKAYISKEGWS